MSVATRNSLTALHAALAETMVNALDAEQQRIEVTKALYEVDLADIDESTAKAISAAISLAPSARVDNGLLKTIAGFLKDNSITSDLSVDPEEDATAKKLAELQKKRRVASTPLDTMQ